MRARVLVGMIACAGVSCGADGQATVKVGARTMADLRSIATALNSYMIDHGAYPIVPRATVDALRTVLSDVYIKDFDLVDEDEWGRPLCVISSGLSFVIWSNGGDGIEDASPKGGPQDSPDSDIIFTQRTDDIGWFWQVPANRDGVAGYRCDRSPIRSVDAELRMLSRLGVQVGR